MIRHTTIAVLLALCIEPSGVAGQALPKATEDNSTTAQSRCSGQEIGRILTQGDLHFKPLDLLCRGDRLNVKKGETVRVECFSNGGDLEFTDSSPDINTRCAQATQAEMPEICAEGNRGHCSESNKGPGNENTPVRISPYNSLLLDGRPFLSWYSVPGATNYVVEIHGKGVNWQKKVAGTNLPYPTEEAAMQPGNAYRVVVVALNGSLPISSPSESSVNLLAEDKANQILKMTRLINSLKIPSDEKAVLDLDSIYMSNGLLTATIKTLEARVRAGSRSPVVYRKLGDRYLEAGLPDRAESSYKTASILAKENDNLVELAKADAGLLLIAKYRSNSRNPS